MKVISMDYSSRYKTYSHPDKKLCVHLLNVADASYNYITNMTADVNMHNIAYISGLLHDIGKSTKYFQHYLLSPNHEFESKELKSHAHISSLISYSIIKEAFNDEVLARYSYLAVKRHHGSIMNILDEYTFKNSVESVDILLRQLNAIDLDELQLLIEIINTRFNITVNIDNVLNHINSTNKIRKFASHDCDIYDENINHYFNIHMLYSCLLMSDKSDVIFKNGKPKSKSPDIKWMDNYRKIKNFGESDAEIDKLKELAYFSTLNNIEQNFNPVQRIYSITLPTGLGKTFTALSAGLKLIEKTNKKVNKIINAIPFTSIIDQTFDIYSDVIKSTNTNTILKHHHLASKKYAVDDDIMSSHEGSFLVETWESGLIVTTFVQLFESIITNDKSSVMKLPNIANSVILLDEIQNINYIHWKLINKILTDVANNLNCYIILLTATQPLIFEQHKEITELVSDYTKYYKVFNRTRLTLFEDRFESLTTFADHVTEYINQHPTENILVMMNSKKNCRDVFQYIRENLRGEKLYYMTTFITPVERKRIIKLIENKNKFGKRKKRRKRIIVFSTQLIEAGVDVSFDTVFREIAPLDSLLQSSGRANRYNESSNISNVFIYELIDRNYAELIYGTILINITKRLLQEYDAYSGIEEKDFLPIIQKYFVRLKQQSNNIHDTMIDNLLALNFNDVGEFRYIQQSIPELPIFIALNNKAKNVFSKYVSIRDSNKPNYEKYDDFTKIRNEFYDYVINVPDNAKTLINLPMHHGFYYWNYATHPPHYQYNPNNFIENLGYVDVSNIVL